MEPLLGPVREPEFAAAVNAVAADPDRRDELADFLREEHAAYVGRGAAAIVQMRGWVLLAIARAGLTDATLPFVLEELAVGHDPYLIAAAARALRSYPEPDPRLAPFVLSGIENIRNRDEPVSLIQFGAFDLEPTTSPLSELLSTLDWLGSSGAGELRRIEGFAASGSGLATAHRARLARMAAALRERSVDRCCSPLPAVKSLSRWLSTRRNTNRAIAGASLEDQDGVPVTFGEFFRRRPTIVVFFYTRCDNPRKCSLTITKLARLQALLAARGLDQRIATAAITYDSEFDRPDRIRRYGLARGVLFAEGHRMFRATTRFEDIRRHFRLGVNYSDSIVNRHRIEAFVLDDQGRVAMEFERLHWSEAAVADHAASLLDRPSRIDRLGRLGRVMGMAASLGVAFFPKCPVCWAAYLSVFGVAGLQSVRYSPWLLPALTVAMLVNLACIAARSFATRRYWPLSLAAAGAVAILGLKLGLSWEWVSLPGVLLTLAGSTASAFEVGFGFRRNFSSQYRSRRNDVFKSQVPAQS